MTPYYYTFDHEGSVHELVDGSGNILTRYTYDPYGKTTTTYVSGTHDAFYQHAGMQTHLPSGLELAVFRVYDPNTGRWLNRDPISERGGINLYEYCGDDPDDRTDPSGLFSPSHPYCRSLAKKIQNIQNDIFKREIEILNNPLNLPGRALNDLLNQNPASSVFGHQQIINKLKADLAMNIALYAAKCSDPEDPPGGTPELAPARCQPCQKVAIVVVATAGGVTTTYVVYRCVRMVPSLFPPLWETIPANAVIP